MAAKMPICEWVCVGVGGCVCGGGGGVCVCVCVCYFQFGTSQKGSFSERVFNQVYLIIQEHKYINFRLLKFVEKFYFVLILGAKNFLSAPHKTEKKCSFHLNKCS